MINYTDTNFLWAEDRPILNAAIPLICEGMGLVGAFENGMPKATIATGSTSDSFLGIALGPRRTFSSFQKIETVVVPVTAPFTVLLTHVVSGAPGAYQAGGAQVATGTGAASSTNVQYSTDPVTGLSLLTFDSSFAGQTFTIAYPYVMSIAEEQGLFGNPNPGFPAESLIGHLQVFLLGKVAVSNWDPQANWYSGSGMPTVKLVAGGIFTDANNAKTGIIPANVRVLYLPSSASPYLGLEIR